MTKEDDGNLNDHQTIQVLCLNGDVDRIIEDLKRKGKRNLKIVRRTLDLLVGLSLKGYEGKPVGTMYLIGDVEGIRRNTTQMIINPFKAWRRINILDNKNQRTFEAFSQLDGAVVIDSRGFAYSAGRMIHISDEPVCGKDFARNKPWERGNTGTRSRAGKFITGVTKTVALSLSTNGDLSVHHGGKEIAKMRREIKKLRTDQLDILIDSGNR